MNFFNIRQNPPKFVRFMGGKGEGVLAENTAKKMSDLR